MQNASRHHAQRSSDVNVNNSAIITKQYAAFSVCRTCSAFAASTQQIALMMRAFSVSFVLFPLESLH